MACLLHSPQPSFISVHTRTDGVLMCWSTIWWTWSTKASVSGVPAAAVPRLGMSCHTIRPSLSAQ